MGAAHPVLVVNAGSSSLKYQVVDAATGEHRSVGVVVERSAARATCHHDGGEHHAEHDVSDARPREALSTRPARPCATTGPTSTRLDLFAVGHRVVHGGARFTDPVLVDDDVLRARCATWPSLAPAAQPGQPRGHRAGSRRLPRRAAGRGLRHRLPPDPAAAGLHVCRPARVARAPRGAPLRLPRHVVRVRVPARRRAAGARPRGPPPRRAAPRQRRQRVRGRGRPQRRHLDGPVTRSRGSSWAPGPGDVDPALGAYLARVAHLSTPRTTTRPLNRAADCSVSPASRTCANRHRAGRGRATPTRPSPSTSSSTGCASTSAATPPPSAALDALVFTGGIGERSAAAASGRRATASACSGSPSTSAANADGAGRAAHLDRGRAAPRSGSCPTDEEGEIARCAPRRARGPRAPLTRAAPRVAPWRRPSTAGGRVYTPDPPPHALVVDRRSASPGSAARRRATGHADVVDAVVDLDGALVLPAFVDAHVHLSHTGMGLRGVDLAAPPRVGRGAARRSRTPRAAVADDPSSPSTGRSTTGPRTAR